MTLSLTTRSGKGSPLTHGEVDQNWTDIQTDVNTIKSDLLGGFKNKIINGNFDFWQRSTSVSGASTGYNSADRWRSSIANETVDVSRQSFVLGQTDVPNNPAYFLRNTVTTVSLSNSVASIIYRIEDVRTFSNSTCTLSFWAKADASKNIAVEFFQDFGTGGSPSGGVSSISVSTLSLTTSWKKFTITANIPSISGKVLGTDQNSFLQIAFWFSAGSDSNARTNSLGTQSGVFDIAQVQLEKGSEATSFEVRPLQVELALCQRYYEKSYNIDVNPGTIIGIGSSSYISPINAISMFGLNRPFKVTKRSVPTMTAYSTATGDSGKMRNDTDAVDVTVSSFVSTSQFSTGHPQLSAAVLEKIITGHWTADAEL